MVIQDRRLWKKFRLPCLRLRACYPEEHYFPTFLSMADPKGCTGYTLTNVNWTDIVNGHPHTYIPSELSSGLIYSLRRSIFVKPYMFARKFSPDCLQPLMDMADTDGGKVGSDIRGNRKRMEKGNGKGRVWLHL
ncbi:hypothetical protein L2E82_21097 [Cichorium intybus]|uniref:Uncharacterized protein n=1 Tax=Cichorium intybus TaxID=13427 RepID=A0ACB9DVL8_CICIN|nr:hypothetical protein L2E82_21097 [Cichorium intybus]